MTIDVSIVVIARNEAEHIADCLAAIQHQRTARRIEIIVVDGASTDGTCDVVDRLAAADPRIRCVRLDRDIGRGSSRQAGLETARGADVAFVDADIVVPPHWLDSLAEDLPGAAAISGVAVPDGDVAALARISGATPRVVPGSATITGNNVLFDGAVLRATRFPETRLGEGFRLAEQLRREGCLLRDRRDIVVRHVERKTYGAALRWLYDSGVDATSLLVEYRRVRLPDVAAFAWLVATVASLVLAVVVTPWFLITLALVTVAAALCHVGTRFRLRPHPMRWAGAAVADVPLVAAYLAGRTVGLGRLGRVEPVRSSGSDQVERAERFREDPLTRGSVHLSVNNLAITALGFLSWMVTTRLWSASDVGVAAAVISAATLGAGLAVLGVQGTLLRSIPGAEDRRAMLATGLVVTVPTAILVGLVLGVLQSAAFGGGPSWLMGFTIFVALVVALLLNSVLGAAAVAVRATRSVIAAGTGGGLVKIATLALLGAASTGPLGIVSAALLATAASVVVLTRSAHAHGLLAGPRRYSRAAVRTWRRYSLTFYVNGLIGAVPMLLLPILVKSHLGSEAAAYWYVASLMATALFQVPSAVGTALLVEGSHRRGELRVLAIRAAVGLVAVMTPLIALAVLVVPVVLGLFGPAYVEESTGPFRIMAFSGLLVCGSYVLGDVLFVRRRLGPLVLLNVVNAVVVLGLAWWATSLDGVAWAWFAGEVANVVLFAILIPLVPERPAANVPEAA